MSARSYTRRQLMMEYYEGKPPAGYEWCDYLENNSSAYFNTGVYPDSTIKADIEVKRTATATTQSGIIASADSGSQQFSLIYLANNRMYYRYGNTYINPSSFLFKDSKMHIVMNAGTVVVDGTTTYKNTGVWSGGVATHAIWIFRGASNGAGYSKMRLYSCKLTVGGVLVRNYRPAKRKSDNKYGLWDLVNKTFTASATTSNFVGGNE